MGEVLLSEESAQDAVYNAPPVHAVYRAVSASVVVHNMGVLLQQHLTVVNDLAGISISTLAVSFILQ